MNDNVVTCTQNTIISALYICKVLRMMFILSLSCFPCRRRSQHCEVEKRRREKMNRYMSELAQMIPACNAVPRKLDKLSVLRMAVDHMKNLRGTKRD